MKTAATIARPPSPAQGAAFAPSTVSVPLSAGGRVDVEPGGRVTIHAAEGELQLEILVTEKGPVLRLAALEIEMEAARDVRVACRNFTVQATGDVTHEAGRSVSLRAAEELSTEATSTRIRSTRGDVEVSANDDVRVQGERIKLNC